jgi:hypothetical protein
MSAPQPKEGAEFCILQKPLARGKNNAIWKSIDPHRQSGEVAEWSIATVLKTVGGASPPGVRIPPSPPCCCPKASDFVFSFISLWRAYKTCFLPHLAGEERFGHAPFDESHAHCYVAFGLNIGNKQAEVEAAGLRQWYEVQDA